MIVKSWRDVEWLRLNPCVGVHKQYHDDDWFKIFHMWRGVDGCHPKVAGLLSCYSIDQLRRMTDQEIAALPCVGRLTVERLRAFIVKQDEADKD